MAEVFENWLQVAGKPLLQAFAAKSNAEGFRELYEIGLANGDKPANLFRIIIFCLYNMNRQDFILPLELQTMFLYTKLNGLTPHDLQLPYECFWVELQDPDYQFELAKGLNFCLRGFNPLL